MKFDKNLVAEIDGTPAECASFAAELATRLGGEVPSKEKPTRRQLVLQAMASLRDQGKFSPRIADIVDMATRLFPDANPKNLDQVVRDLANRTDTVERLRWGCFGLVDREGEG